MIPVWGAYCFFQMDWNSPTSGTRWWFQIFFIFTPIWGRFPFWLIFFKGVETPNLVEDSWPYQKKCPAKGDSTGPRTTKTNGWNHQKKLSGWWQLKYFLFSPRNLGKWSNLTSIFFKGVETTKKNVVLLRNGFIPFPFGVLFFWGSICPSFSGGVIFSIQMSSVSSRKWCATTG